MTLAFLQSLTCQQIRAIGLRHYLAYEGGCAWDAGRGKIVRIAPPRAVFAPPAGCDCK